MKFFIFHSLVVCYSKNTNIYAENIALHNNQYKIEYDTTFYNVRWHVVMLDTIINCNAVDDQNADIYMVILIKFYDANQKINW